MADKPPDACTRPRCAVKSCPLMNEYDLLAGFSDFYLLLSQIGFLSHWDPYAVISLEAVAYSSYCNTVEWFWWD